MRKAGKAEVSVMNTARWSLAETTFKKKLRLMPFMDKTSVSLITQRMISRFLDEENTDSHWIGLWTGHIKCTNE